MTPTTKSRTDLHWNTRAATETQPVHVNITDINQRELEYDHVCRFLTSDMDALEVGCGNGYSTNRFRPLVKHLDAFDFAENMIEQAKREFGETNNRFFHDNVLEPQHFKPQYDTVICVRVLINLRDLTEQHKAIHNLLRVLRPGGRFILVEGYQEGFQHLTELREQVGLQPVQPAPINFYSTIPQVRDEVEKHCDLVDEFHLGAYDYLTRVVYPAVTPAGQVKHNSPFADRAAALARAFNDDAFRKYSRLLGMVFTKHKG